MAECRNKPVECACPSECQREQRCLNPTTDLKYTVDVFTEQSVFLRDKYGRGHPDDTFEADSLTELTRILRGCSREDAGVCKVEVWIGTPPEPEATVKKWRDLWDKVLR